MEVSLELCWVDAQTGAQVAHCVGGMDPRAERRVLQAGCHIVVGTPGRLRDHLERGALDLSALRVVVLDEADEMLRSEEHTSELQSLMRISYAVFCLKKKTKIKQL